MIFDFFCFFRSEFPCIFGTKVCISNSISKIETWVIDWCLNKIILWGIIFKILIKDSSRKFYSEEITLSHYVCEKVKTNRRDNSSMGKTIEYWWEKSFSSLKYWNQAFNCPRRNQFNEVVIEIVHFPTKKSFQPTIETWYTH